MAPPPTTLFCGKLFYIGECLSRESRVPIPCAPKLTDDELHTCDEIITHLQSNRENSDLLSMLIKTFRIAKPIEFENKLSRIISASLVVEREQGDIPDEAAEYWFRIANTFNKLFVLEAAQERTADESFQGTIEMAWEYYYRAVQYALDIDANIHLKHQVVPLDWALADCGTVVETLLKQMVVPERTEVGEGTVA